MPASPIALVTGAARRIGRTVALDLAAAGWDIAVHHNSSAGEAEAVAADVRALGRRASVLAADLADAIAVEQLMPACVAALGAPSCLVNNASLFLPDDVGRLTTEQWERHHAINLRSPVMLAQAFAKALPQGQSGNIINIVDQRVWKPTPLFFSYAVSKAGLFAATQMLAQALAPRIRVNAIGPGPTLASIHQSPEAFAAQARELPLQRATTPQEIATAVRFLLSAPSITGQMLALDGGQHLAWRTPDVVADAAAMSPPAAGPRLPVAAPPYGVRHVVIDRLEIGTMIGVHDAERRAPQRVHIWVDLAVREDGPSRSDRLEDVVDYGALVKRIEAIAAAGHINLVETLAERIASDALSDPRALQVQVRVEKPDVIANAAAVGVQVTRTKSEQF